MPPVKKFPTDEDDIVTLKYLSKLKEDLEFVYKKRIKDLIYQTLFVFGDKIDEKISNTKSLLLINLVLKLDGELYKIENGNSELFYIFPCNAVVRKFQYNIEHVLIETKINNKSLSLEGQSVSANDKLNFLPIKGRKTPKNISVEILLETNLI